MYYRILHALKFVEKSKYFLVFPMVFCGMFKKSFCSVNFDIFDSFNTIRTIKYWIGFLSSLMFLLNETSSHKSQHQKLPTKIEQTRKTVF